MRQQAVYTYDLLRVLVGRDMKIRYKRSFLGIAWSLLNPLMQLFVFIIVFQRVLPLDIPNYPLFVFTGLLTWTWLQSSLMAATTSIVDHRELLKQPHFPAAILPIVMMTTNLVHFVLALPILFGMIALARLPVSPAMLLLPAIMLVQCLLIVSVSYFLATLHVTFRDTQYLLGVFLLLGFYLTPIFYDFAIITDPYRTILQLNPMLHLVEAYRAVLLYGEYPPAFPLCIISLLSIGFFLWGYRVFTQTSYNFVEEL